MLENISALEKIKRIMYWQQSFMVHPLTCGSNSCGHTLMLPRLSNERQDEVEIYCPKCNRIQTFIPKCCYSSSIEDFKKAEEELKNMFPSIFIKKNNEEKL